MDGTASNLEVPALRFDQDTRPRLSALSGIRYLAVSGVIFFHYCNLSWFPRRWLNQAADCLAIFFVLSGFVIFYRYAGPADNVRIDRRKFWTSRFARIYPVYFAAFLLATPTDLAPLLRQGHTVPDLLASWLAAVALLQAWVPAFSKRWNTPAWTLSVEAFLYFVFPFVAARIRYLYGGVRWLVIALILVLCINGFRLDASLPPIYLASFLLGMIASREFMLRGLLIPGPPWLSAIPTCGLAIFILVNPVPWSFWHEGVLQVLTALSIYCLAGDRSWVGRFLGWAPLAVLGEASYALYILQLPVWVWLYHLREFWTQQLGPTWLASPTKFFSIYFILLNVISLASHRYVEPAARRWCLNLISKRGTLQMNVSATK